MKRCDKRVSEDLERQAAQLYNDQRNDKITRWVEDLFINHDRQYDGEFQEIMEEMKYDEPFMREYLELRRKNQLHSAGKLFDNIFDEKARDRAKVVV